MNPVTINPSYSCSATPLKVLLALASAVDYDGNQMTGIVTDVQGGDNTRDLDFSKLSNMPVLLTSDGRMVFAPSMTD